jgi:UDP-N-acetylglucosamine--N-acetylmuramyl-(pentapeptide) pyrophosphoryl-undecaprenol N-acetylglucosamine transferase
MRILFSGGGTAGHIYPALAMAAFVKEKYPEAKIAFVGTPHGMENRLVGAAGYPIFHTDVRGLSRSLSPKNLTALYLALRARGTAKKILSEFRPDAVIGTGGYVCYPILREAARCGIPCAIHESNACPGLSARMLAPHMDAIWLNFAEGARRLPRGCVTPVHTGNPLRAGFQNYKKEAAREKLKIAEKELYLLSFGGSLGADAINRAVFHLYERMHLRYPRLRLLHICGVRYYEEWKDRFAPFAPRATLCPYLEEMPLHMAAADIVVCRAGAMTLSELASARKCAILLPSPHVTGNHQYENAAALANAGAAMLAEESELADGRLEELFEALWRNPLLRRRCEEKIATFSLYDTKERILSEIERLCAKKRNNPTYL